MMRIEPSENALNLLSFLVGPGGLRIIARGLHRGPPAQRRSAQNLAPTTASLADDPSADRIDLRGAARRRQPAAANALVEDRSESEKCENAYLEAQRGLRGRHSAVQGVQKTQRRLEDLGRRLVVRKALTNRSQPSPGGSHRVEISKYVQVGALDRDALKVFELASAFSQLCPHEHVGLQRTAKPAMALARTSRQSADLAEILGQQCDDPVGVAIIDRP